MLMASARCKSASSLDSSTGPGVAGTAASVSPPPSACCLALCSSIDTLSASASSGSSLGSTPNSNPPPLLVMPAPLPSSPCTIGEETNASLRCGPGGIVTKWEPVPSFPLIVVTNLFNKSVFDSSSPKLTMSMLTFSFFSFLASLIISFSSASMGDPTKATILVLWFLPCLCLRARWAILIPEINLISFNGRPNKGNNPGLVVLALPVLKGQVGDFDSRDKSHVSRGSHLVQLCQYFSSISSEGDQDCQVSEGHQGHIGLRVGPCVRVGDQVNGILLRL